MYTKQINNIIKKWELLDFYAFSMNKNKMYDENPLLKDISNRQLEILMAIVFEGINTVTVLAKNMNLSKSTLSLIITKMEKKGLITRTNDKNKDNRFVCLESTELGKEVIFEYFHVRARGMQVVYDNMTVESRMYFVKGISYLRQMIGEITSSYSKLCDFIFKNEREKFSDISDELLNMSRDIMYFMAVFFNSSDSMKKQLAQLKETARLTLTQIRVMGIILKENITSVSQLEKITKTSVSALSICISRLEKKGYIEKQYDRQKGDGRRKYLKITPEGMKALSDERAKAKNVKTKFLETLNQEQLNAYDEALDCLLLAVKDL